MKIIKRDKIPTYGPYTGEINPLFCDEVKTKEQIDDIKYVHKNLMEGLRVPPSDKDIDKMPNQKWHQIISFIKSGIRIFGYILIPFDLIIATSVLVFSEIIGVVEELV